LIETPRLMLRAWREDDRDRFAALNGDPRVGEWLGGVRSRAECDAALDRFNVDIAAHGFGYWAAERKSDRRLIGLIGLGRFQPNETPLGETLEMAWRLVPDAWGQGLASEGAAAALAWGLANLDEEILAITARTNLRSQAVMRRIGMTAQPSRDFDHPKLPQGHPLRPHVVFAAPRP
jgi:RimJ/RimL family protein N-acetyltransferase